MASEDYSKYVFTPRRSTGFESIRSGISEWGDMLANANNRRRQRESDALRQAQFEEQTRATGAREAMAAQQMEFQKGQASDAKKAAALKSLQETLALAQENPDLAHQLLETQGYKRVTPEEEVFADEMLVPEGAPEGDALDAVDALGFESGYLSAENVEATKGAGLRGDDVQVEGLVEADEPMEPGYLRPPSQVATPYGASKIAFSRGGERLRSIEEAVPDAPSPTYVSQTGYDIGDVVGQARQGKLDRREKSKGRVLAYAESLLKDAPGDQQEILERIAARAGPIIDVFEVDEVGAVEMVNSLVKEELNRVAKKRNAEIMSGARDSAKDDFNRRAYETKATGLIGKLKIDEDLTGLRAAEELMDDMNSMNPTRQTMAISKLAKMADPGGRITDKDFALAPGFKSLADQVLDWLSIHGGGTLSESRVKKIVEGVRDVVVVKEKRLQKSYDTMVRKQARSESDIEDSAYGGIIASRFDTFDYYRPTPQRRENLSSRGPGGKPRKMSVTEAIDYFELED